MFLKEAKTCRAFCQESCVDVASFTDFEVSMEKPEVTLLEDPGTFSGYVDLTVVRTGDLACLAEVTCSTATGTMS